MGLQNRWCGISSITGDENILFADNISFCDTETSGAIDTDGQIWIGATDANLPNNCGHVRKGFITGSSDISVTNGPGTIALSLTGSGVYKSLSPYIVGSDTHSGYATISLAIADAVSAGASSTSPANIYIKPKSSGYTENITLFDGINLVGFGEMTKIIGKISCSYSGKASISGLDLQTNSDYSISVTGSAVTELRVYDCHFNSTNNTSIQYTTSNASSNIRIFNSQCNLGTTGISFYTMSSTGVLHISDCYLKNDGNSTTASANSAGSVIYYNSTSNICVSTSANGNVSIDRSLIFMNTNTTAVTQGGTALPGNISNSRLVSGSAVAVSIGAGAFMTVSNATITSTNASAMSGAGTLTFGDINFASSSTISTTAQIPLVSTNTAIKVTTPGAYPYTTVPQDGIILVDTSSARTITPLASPATGQRHIIKDSVGSANANNITITPSGKNIDGAASFVISSNYGSVNIVYNGTEWNVF